MVSMDLGGQWRMRRLDGEDWIPARVPGSVFHDLLEAGKIEDPFYRDNEEAALEIASHDYLYEREFTADAEMLAQDRVVLHCLGLDTLCRLELNGSLVAETDNMHRTYEFDVRHLLKAGKNTLQATLFSPVRFVQQKNEENPIWGTGDAVEGFPHLRKAHCMFGWDWGPKIPDSGIWRPVSLKGFCSTRLEDVYITQFHQEGPVKLDVRVISQAWSSEAFAVKVSVVSPQGEVFAASAEGIPGEQHLQMEITNPRLWWPNGLGEHPLYQVRVELRQGGRILDAQQFRIGLRTLTVARNKDQWGESFEFQVNGVPIFAKGADYIPEDNLLARCTPERTKRLIQDCAEANFNCIRVWGGGHYPEDYFYDFCDEYGLMVWQDLMFACAAYEMNEAFTENIRLEALDNMKRIRHHASLGLWCGNNEMEWGWEEWDFPKVPRLRTDYIKQFEILLPQVARQADPNTFYWLASPSSGGSFDRPNDENIGDAHYWEVWHGRKPFVEYRKHFFRFASEFGLQSFPCLKTVETFTLPEDRNVFSYVMERHQKNGTSNAKILHYISENFRYPNSFDALLYTSQLVQAEGMRYGVEHWRRNTGRCMGAVYWQLNDCWPVASWASIDYFGRWKALHYLAKRFFAPVLLSACEEGPSVQLAVTNDTFEPVKGSIKWALRDRGSRVLEEGTVEVDVPPFTASTCVELDFASALTQKGMDRRSFLEFSLETAEGCLSEGTVLFCKAKHFEFRDPEIKAEVEECPDCFQLKVTATAYARYVELDLKEADAIFSDNYFDLFPGRDKLVRVAKDRLSRDVSLEEFREALRIRSLFDIG